MDRTEFRKRVLRAFGAGDSVLDELLHYNENVFNQDCISSKLELPLSDEPFLSAWERYCAEAEPGRILEYLRDRLVQLRFPIRRGVSSSEAYRMAVLKGIQDEGTRDEEGLALTRPEALRLFLHSSPAGRLPILVPSGRNDFVCLIQALTAKNEPEHVPDSMGAAIVSGYNNWDRFNALRQRWESEHPDDFLGLEWAGELRRIIPRKELYQDRFVIVGDGFYSNVSPTDMGLSDDAWRRASLLLRTEHECTHYFTLRLFGSMRNRLLDEVLADFMGLTAAMGSFRSEWFLRFVGLELFPLYRKGGRLENYRGDPPLSEEAFRILQSLTVSLSLNLERFEEAQRQEMGSGRGRALALMALTFLSVEELASDEAPQLLQDALQRAETLLSKGTPLR